MCYYVQAIDGIDELYNWVSSHIVSDANPDTTRQLEQIYIDKCFSILGNDS